MAAGKIESDPLFVGLTRPSMIFGVSIQYALLNMIFCAAYFIQTTSFKIIFVAGIIHAIGYIICFKEPRFVELYMTYFSKCNKCKNKRYYSANSYYV